MYQLFRPEFLKNYHIPLSSDAFSNLGKDNYEEHNREVLEATTYLFDTTIREFAMSLEMQEQNDSLVWELTELTHRSGINIRYLGVVRQAVTSEKIRRIIFNEMCARVAKNQLRYNPLLRCERMCSLLLISQSLSPTTTTTNVLDWHPIMIRREIMRQKANELKRQAALVDAEFRTIVIVFLNRVLDVSDGDFEDTTYQRHRQAAGAAASSSSSLQTRESWWVRELPEGLKAQFRDALTPEEQANLGLRRYLDTYTLFKRIQQLTGIKLTKRAMQELKEDPESFQIVLSDVKKISAKAKHMNIISLAEAQALSIRAMRSQSDKCADRLFRLAMLRFDTAIRATPDNTVRAEQLLSLAPPPLTLLVYGVAWL